MTRKAFALLLLAFVVVAAASGTVFVYARYASCTAAGGTWDVSHFACRTAPPIILRRDIDHARFTTTRPA